MRHFRPERAARLAVVDVPGDVLAISVSRKLLDAAGLHVGGEDDIEIERA